ncbi:MAG TPA: GAF domain-containing protein [Steroidobacteraceae bacterium]|nr:GAF domain-containing protein [Steroidobacteraceae bacterium]
MTQPAPEFPDADILSLDVDLAEVTAEMPALVRVDEARGREQAAVSGFADDPTEMEAAGNANRAPSALEESKRALLRQAAEVVRAGVTADEMLRALFNDIREPMGVDAYFNFMVNDAGDALALAACGGVSESEARAYERIEFGQALSGNVALKRAALVVADVQSSSDRRVQVAKELGIRAVACHPLIASDRLLGTLSFASRTRDAFGADDLTFFAAMARMVALSHERSRLARELAAVDAELDAMRRGASVGADSVQCAPAAMSSHASPNTTEVLSFAVRSDGTAVETRASTAKEAVGAHNAAGVDEQSAATAGVQSAGGADLTGDAHLASGARVTGDAHLASGARVTGDARLAPGVHVKGDAHLAPSVRVTGDAHLASGVRVTGDAHLAPGAPVTGDAHLAGGAHLVRDADLAGETSLGATRDAGHAATSADESANAMSADTQDAMAPETSSEASAELFYAEPMGAEVILFSRYVASPGAQPVDSIPLGLIEAAPVTALEVSPLVLPDASEGPAPHEVVEPERVESEITVELCALDPNAAAVAAQEEPALDLSSHEIAALDLRPVETIEVSAHDKSAPAAPAPPAPDDDEAPTVEVKALAIQELEAERAPLDDGEDITFTYVPPT